MRAWAAEAVLRLLFGLSSFGRAWAASMGDEELLTLFEDQLGVPPFWRKGLVVNLTLLYAFGCVSVVMEEDLIVALAAFCCFFVTFALRMSQVLLGTITWKDYFLRVGDWGVALAVTATTATDLLFACLMTLGLVSTLLTAILFVSVRAMRRVSAAGEKKK